MLGMQAPTGQWGIAFAQQSIPDAPKPQIDLPPGGVTSGIGASTSNEGSSSDGGTPQNTAAPEPSAPQPPAAQPSAPEPASPAGAPASPAQNNSQNTYVPSADKAQEAIQTYRVNVNAVDLAFTVKDSKGRMVPGLEPRDIQVYENGLRQHIDVFTRDALPLSVAIVIDQSMTQDQMDRVNTALGALQDAFTRYDEVSVFTYNKSTRQITDFTGAQSPRAAQAIERSKSSGREALLPGSLEGPLSQTTVVNDMQFDPNTAANRGHTGSMSLTPPKELHPLNDAILAAATSLSRRPVERRRVIYVISNGNEYGSQAKTSQVIQYLQRNFIEVDGTLVGDTALPVVGFLDKIHLPLQMRDNVLVTYQKATGGQVDSEFRLAGIEKSFSAIASEARYRYTVLYRSPEPFIDGKYRKTVIVVLNHGNDLTVLASPGYWPSMALERQLQQQHPTQ